MVSATTTCSRPQDSSRQQETLPDRAPAFTAAGVPRPGFPPARRCATAAPAARWAVRLLAAFLVVGLWAAPSLAFDTTDCCVCHGTLQDVHGDWDHTAIPGSGPVTFFPDSGHDSAGRSGDKPYFAVTVECTTCHVRNLPAIHGNDCDTCHPSPYDTLGIWGKGCQQGGCHTFYHQDSIQDHRPFEDPTAPGNECLLCHVQSTWDVTDAKCLNCHDGGISADLTAPFTTADLQAAYTGPARIDFSINDNGLVGQGRTFYILDGGPITAAGKYLWVTDPGPHDLEFWSIDQYGNAEAETTSASFTVDPDTLPPTTTSDAKSSYTQGATINLSAVDNGTLGVKTTYYRVNDGPIKTGSRVVIPATNGTVAYTVSFWSEDWSGNVEAQNSVSFTVESGNGTIRLVWWYSDVWGSPCPDDPEAKASWTVRAGNRWGPVVASGSAGCPNWDGIDDVSVPVAVGPYYVRIDWWNSWEGYYEPSFFPYIYVTTPGQVVKINY